MADNGFDIREFERKIQMSLHPRKPVYRHVGWRKGRKVYEQVCWRVGGRYVKMHRNPYLGLQLRTGDPKKFKRDRAILRFFRVLRRSTQWYDRERGFWKGLLGK